MKSFTSIVSIGKPCSGKTIHPFFNWRTSQGTWGYIKHGLSIDIVKLRQPLYNDFYLTPLGIFRFGNPKYIGDSTILFSPDLVLPKRTSQNSKNVEAES